MIVATVRFRLLLLSLSLTLLQGITSGQDTPPLAPSQSKSVEASPEDMQVIIKRSVNRVVVDVVVTDSNGKPVHGLNKQDFSIEEDGKTQSILSFDVHTLDSNPTLAPKLPPLPANTFVNVATAPERGPLYVLLLDLVNTEPEDQPYACQQLLKFIANKPLGTRFAAFVLADGLHLVQGFTSDRDRLSAALDPSHPKSHVPRLFLEGRNYGKGDPALSVSVFDDIAMFLDGLPGRKNVIWISGGFPLDLFPHDETNDGPDLHEETNHALDRLAKSDSSIYTVSLTGVQAYPPGRLTGGTPNGSASLSSSGPINFGGSGPPASAAVSPSGGSPVATSMAVAGRTGSSVYDDYMAQDSTAAMTGGRAFYSRNDLKDALEEATEAGADYYTLTYSPSNSNYDGKLRAIHVRLTNKEYRLEYRRAYFATGPEGSFVATSIAAPNSVPQQRPIGDSLSANMHYGAPTARQVYFLAHVQALGTPQLATPEQMANLSEQPAYFRERRKIKAGKTVAPIQLQSYLIQYKIISRQPHLEVAAGAFDSEGRLLNGDVEDASSSKPPTGEPAKDTYFRVDQKIDVPLAAATIRVAVRDLATDHIGAMEITLPLAPEVSQATLPASGSASASETKPH